MENQQWWRQYLVCRYVLNVVSHLEYDVSLSCVLFLLLFSLYAGLGFLFSCVLNHGCNVANSEISITLWLSHLSIVFKWILKHKCVETFTAVITYFSFGYSCPLSCYWWNTLYQLFSDLKCFMLLFWGFVLWSMTCSFQECCGSFFLAS
jgi:hypothetical protein